MTLVAAKIVWMLGCVGWYAIRYPHQRRSRRTPVAERRDRVRDTILMTVSFTGLFAIPFTYALTGQPEFATYAFHPPLAWLGVAVLTGAMALFYRTHRDLGRAWSVTLEIREEHRMVTHGIYARLRHAVLLSCRPRGTDDAGDVRRGVPTVHGQDEAAGAGDLLTCSASW